MISRILKLSSVNYVLISIFAFLDKYANKKNFYARTEDTCSSSTINRLVADPSLCFYITYWNAYWMAGEQFAGGADVIPRSPSG